MDLTGGNVAAGTVAWVWNCNGLPQQKFGLSAGITLRILADYSYCLDLADGKTDNGTPIQIWKCNGQVNQKWSFENWQIRSMADNKKCIDAGQMTKGIYLQIWDCN